MTLTPKQATFVREYLIDLNATQAAIRAGYSPKTANEQSSRLLANVKIASAIQNAVQERSERTEIRADEVLMMLRRQYMFDIADLYDEFGDLRDPKTLPDDIRFAIAGIDVTEHFIGGADDKDRVLVRTKKYRLPNRMDAINAAMKHLGIQGADRADLTTNGHEIVPTVIILPANGRDS